MSNLKHADLHKGLPTTYQELALLIRQLSLLSTELGSAKESTVHSDLIKMLDRVDELNKVWHGDQKEEQPSEVEDSIIKRRKSPVSKTQVIMGPTRGREPNRQIRQKGKENKPIKGVLKKPIGNRGVIKPRQVTPERKATLTAGIAALVEARQPGKGLAWNIPVKESEHHQHPKSLILPANLQRKREKAQQALAAAAVDSHYADPTVASRLKAVLHDDHERSFSAPASPRGRDISFSPERGRSRSPWRPCGTPSKSPGSGIRRARSQSPGMTRQRFQVHDVDDNLVRTLFPEGRQSRNTLKKSYRENLDHVTPTKQRPLSSSNRIVNQAEEAIRQRLRPLLDQAESIAQRHEMLLKKSDYSVPKQFDKADEQLVSDGDVGDMILNDILRDTAEELQMIELDNKIRKEAVTMQDSPTLENLLQRLEQMENEQFEIRQRWGTVHFDEEESVSTRIKKLKSFEEDVGPLPPVAMEITKHTAAGTSKHKNMAWNQEKEDEPIIFTKSKSKSQWEHKSLPQNESGDDQEHYGYDHVTSRRPIELDIPRNLVENIHSNLEKYERHLKKTSHQTLGKFDPWKLVEEIADNVLDDCLRDIELELDDLNSAIVNQVCKSEFMIAETNGSWSRNGDQSGARSPQQQDEDDYEEDFSIEITENTESELEEVTDDVSL